MAGVQVGPKESLKGSPMAFLPSAVRFRVPVPTRVSFSIADTWATHVLPFQPNQFLLSLGNGTPIDI